MANQIIGRAESVKKACIKIISGEMTKADCDMYLRAIISDMDFIEKMVEEAE